MCDEFCGKDVGLFGVVGLDAADVVGVFACQGFDEGSHGVLKIYIEDWISS
jgi:hypothetical protein